MTPDDLIALDERLEEVGWDNPGRLIALPNFMATGRALVEFEGHPCEVLHSMWESGVRVEEATALGLVVEGRRHMTIEEIRETAPSAYEQLHSVVAEELEDEERIRALVEKGWNETIASLSPLQMPENITKQVRNTIVVLHTGVIVGVVRDFDGEPEPTNPVPAERLHLSRVPHFMWQFLVGQEPTD